MTENSTLARIMSRHPALFGGHNGASPVVPSCGGWIPTGWFDIVDHLCARIEQILGDRVTEFHVVQIKEKFGTLRFSFQFEFEIQARQRRAQQALAQTENVPDVLRRRNPIQRFLVGHSGLYSVYAPSDDSPDARLRSDIVDACRDAKLQTEACCILCGSTQSPLLHTRYGYIRTLCYAHAKGKDHTQSKPAAGLKSSVRQFASDDLDWIRLGYWSDIRSGELVDYLAFADIPPEHHSRLDGCMRHTLPEIGEAVRIEDFYQVFGVDKQDWAPPLSSEDEQHAPVQTLAEYWRTRHGCEFPSLPEIP